MQQLIDRGIRPGLGVGDERLTPGDIFAQMRQRVKVARGPSAQVERIEVGDGGWAYGSSSQSEAAARAGGKVYHVRMSGALSTTMHDRKDAMVQLVTRMVD